MPKVLPSARRNRALHQQRHQHHDHTNHHQHDAHHPQLVSSPQHSHNVLLTSPRKVSFEHQSSSSSFGSATSLSAFYSGSSSCSSSCQQDSLALSSSQSRSSLCSLRRKAPSSCLAGLVEESSCSDDVATSSTNSQDCESFPTSAMHTDAEATVRNDATTVSAPSSPWGHFVDLLVPLDEVSTLCGSSTTSSRSRGWGDIGAPLFDSLGPSSSEKQHEEDDALTFAPRRSNGRGRHHHRHQQQRSGSHSGHSMSHPYGLQPRHVRRRQLLRRPRSCSEGDASLSSSFLPGFFLETPVAATATAAATTMAPVFHRLPSIEVAPARKEPETSSSLTVVPGEDTRSVEKALQRLTVGNE